MFLELCQQYTQAINKGCIPNINSAWNNLCKNENLRAIQQAISLYQQRIQKQALTMDPDSRSQEFIIDLN